MAKAKPKSPFTGRWRIVSMSAWDEDFIDEEEEGFFEFDDEAGASSTSATSTDRWIAAKRREMANLPSSGPGTATMKWTRRRAEAGPW